MQLSIVIPFFKRFDLLKETIQSVLDQNLENWELILVNDGLNEDIPSSIIHSVEEHPKIKIIQRNRTPKGATTCRNIGAEQASSDYLVFLDSDDLISKDFVEKRINTIKDHKGADFVVFPSGYFTNRIGDHPKIWNAINKKRNDLKRFFDEDTPWHTSGPIWKKDSFLKIGGFWEPALSGQDWELHVKALLRGLKYYKVEDTRENLNHYIRTGDYESITSDFQGGKKLLNRIQMFEHMAEEIAQSGFIDQSIRGSIIKYYYKIAGLARDQGLSEAVHQIFQSLSKTQLIGPFLRIVLQKRLSLPIGKNTLLKRLIDSYLLRSHGIRSIDFPEGRTKGTLNAADMPFELC